MTDTQKQWSKEPWTLFPDSGLHHAHVRDADGKVILIDAREANLERIAACVNFCAGISQEFLTTELPFRQWEYYQDALELRSLRFKITEAQRQIKDLESRNLDLMHKRNDAEFASGLLEEKVNALTQQAKANKEAQYVSRSLCDKCVKKLHLLEQWKQSDFGTLEGCCDFCGSRLPTREFDIRGGISPLSQPSPVEAQEKK